jgi:hypothetical protein
MIARSTGAQSHQSAYSSSGVAVAEARAVADKRSRRPEWGVHGFIAASGRFFDVSCGKISLIVGIVRYAVAGTHRFNRTEVAYPSTDGGALEPMPRRRTPTTADGRAFGTGHPQLVDRYARPSFR